MQGLTLDNTRLHGDLPMVHLRFEPGNCIPWSNSGKESPSKPYFGTIKVDICRLFPVVL